MHFAQLTFDKDVKLATKMTILVDPQMKTPKSIANDRRAPGKSAAHCFQYQ